METNTKTIRPFWAIIIVGVVAFIAGGVVMWMVYNFNLQEELDSIVPNKSAMEQHPTTTVTTQEK